jgi:hypothetical protein
MILVIFNRIIKETNGTPCQSADVKRMLSGRRILVSGEQARAEHYHSTVFAYI